VASHSSKNARRLGIGVATTAVALAGLIGSAGAAAAGSPATAGSAAARPVQRLALTALAFSAKSVNATAGNATVTLTWTVTDSRTTARRISGELSLAAPGKVAGSYLTERITVPFALHGPAHAGGTARRSKYAYTFTVPQYAQASSVRWEVISLTVQDNKGDKLGLPAAKLTRFKATLSAQEVAVTSGPSFDTFRLYNDVRPYVYSGAKSSGEQVYNLCVYPSPAGFTNGTLQLSGPAGQSFSSQFSYNQVAPECMNPWTRAVGQQYIVPVRFPAGLTAGTWTVSRLQLKDTAGNVTTASELGAPVTVTGNQVLSANDFTASPNPANDWAQAVTVTVSMMVSGVHDGVSAIYLDFAGDTPGNPGNCGAAGEPTSAGPGQESVQFQMTYLTTSCQLVGVAILDGAGDLALYGSEYGAPDAGLTVTQTPDTTPPTATSASISLGTGNVGYWLTIGVTTQVAPVTGVAVRFYNADGVLQTAADTNGGVSQQPPIGAGTVSFPFDTSALPSGTYTMGFTLFDAANLASSYGPGGSDPVPGGSLTVTVP
jgi:hypothetical protein